MTALADIKGLRAVLDKVEIQVRGLQALEIESDQYNALLTKREVKMAGYWPSSFFAFLWTETKSRSIKTQKKNEANIQPS